MQIIERPQYLDRIQPYIDTDIIKVITGMRRSGKSVLLGQIQERLIAKGVPPENIISLNLEVMDSLAEPTARALREAVLQKLPADGAGRGYVFLDEVQDVPGWERAVNSLRVERDVDIFLTGSNAHLLSGELATLLSGRYVEIPVYPLSFSEFLRLYPGSDERDAFTKYLTLGGMPYLAQVGFSHDASMPYLQDIFATVELRDIVQRSRIRDVELLNRLLAYTLSNIGTPFSARSLTRFFRNEGRQVSVDTILSYLQAGTNAYLFHRIPREDLRGKRLLSVAEKYYVTDHGIREAVSGGNTRDVQLVLENIVCMELVRRGYTVRVGANNGREIDFVAHRADERMYVQVTYLLATPETVEREFSAFDGILDHYPKYVVSMDEINLSRNGVRHWNIRDFLTAESWS